jgi:hypothetical protein
LDFYRAVGFGVFAPVPHFEAASDYLVFSNSNRAYEDAGEGLLEVGSCIFNVGSRISATDGEAGEQANR